MSLLSVITNEGWPVFFAKAAFNLSAASRIECYELLADYMKAGTDLKASIEEFDLQAAKEGKKDTDAARVRFKSWINAIKRGKRLCDAIKGWVPERERMLIEAYESSTNIADGLSETVRMMERSGEMKSIWLGAIAYPLFLFMMAGGVLHIYGVSVIPKFALMYSPTNWTGDAANLELITRLVVSYWPYMILAVLSGVALLIYSLPRWTGTFRQKLEVLPPFSFYKLDEGATCMVALTAMLEAGTPVLNAVETIRGQASPWLRERLNPVVAGMKKGKSMGVALQSSGFHFPDKRLVSLMVLHSDKKTFIEALPHQVDRWITSQIKSMRKKAAILNNLAMGAVAALAAWIYLAMGDVSTLVTQAMQRH